MRGGCSVCDVSVVEVSPTRILGRDLVARDVTAASLVLHAARRYDQLDLGLEAADQIGHDAHRVEPLHLRGQPVLLRGAHQSRQVAIGPPRLVT